MTRAKEVFNVEVRGEGEPPLVLLHGFGASNFSWRFWTDQLAESHALHLIELKGFGEASRDPEGGFGPLEQARLVESYIEEAGLHRPVLVGHSFGGGVALLAALSLQDAGRPVGGLILVSAAAYPQAIPIFIRLARIPLLGEAVFSVLPARTLMRLALRRVTYRPEQVTDADIEGHARAFHTLSRRFTMIRAARELLPEGHEGFVRRFREVDSPTLLLWGEEDPVIPVELGRRLAHELPRSELVTLPECGHLPPEEQPEESARAVLRFLEKHEL